MDVVIGHARADTRRIRAMTTKTRAFTRVLVYSEENRRLEYNMKKLIIPTGNQRKIAVLTLLSFLALC